jgi:hypothetical protein
MDAVELSMMIRRTFTATALAAVAISGLAASPASAAKQDDSTPVLLNEETAAVTAGTSVWLHLAWVAKGDIDDFRITAKANHGATIEYSETTGDHAGPMNGYQLLTNETDFTAIRLIVPGDVKDKEVRIDLKTIWTEDGKSKKKDIKVNVPIAQHSGDDWALVNNVSTSGDGWIEMTVTGLAPKSEGLRFSVVDDADTNPYLPHETWTGPDHDDLIEVGETDVVRFYIEPGSVPTGEHTITFAANWTSGNKDKSINFPFTVAID